MRLMKTGMSSCFLLVTSLLGLTLARGIETQNHPATEPSGANPQRSLARLAELAGGTDVVAKPDNAKEKKPYLSPGVAEVVRMHEAGLDAPVIQAYIENSTILYRVNADDLVYLHEHQIAPALITALIKRGAELRAQAAQAQKESQNQAAQAQATASPTVAAPAYTAPAQPSTPIYVQSYPSDAYATYPAYSYASPIYYASSYPSFGYRPFGFCGFRPCVTSSFCSPRFGFSANFVFGNSRFHGGHSFCHSGFVGFHRR